jgi:benzaldehyde dehydrogenase (NAD)
MPPSAGAAVGQWHRISGPAIWEEFTQWVWVTTRPDAVIYPF